MAMCYTDFSQRGVGFTTLQMKTAPKGALYVVKGDVKNYLELKRDLERRDILVISVDKLSDREYFRGKINEIIIDHSVLLNPQQIDILRGLRVSMRSRWAGL